MHLFLVSSNNSSISQQLNEVIGAGIRTHNLLILSLLP